MFPGRSLVLAMILLTSLLPSAPADVLPGKLPDHPRLLAQAGDWARLREQAKTDPFTAALLAALQKRGDALLTLPPEEHKLEGRRLLAVSRSVLERVGTLALLANVTGDSRYARRAAQEMMAAAQFPDWNPAHFLDVAEMSLALALGYDWLYQQLSPDERDTIARALIDKGLLPSFSSPPPGFLTMRNNWNQVCNAGLSCAAIALADRDRPLAEKTLARALHSLPASTAEYAPDGVYSEGAMYWGYGTTYYVLLAAALERLTGSDQGLAEVPGFAHTADYLMQVTTPRGDFYPYSDSRPDRNLQPPLFWLARKFSHPEWLALDLRTAQDKLARSENRFLPFILLWRDPSLTTAAAPAQPPPRYWLGRGPVPLAIFRSSFSEPGALFAAIKGGSPKSSHGHMDAGSFMLQSQGVDWAVDLGMQSYESIESLKMNLWNQAQGSDRWKIFRIGPDSHNILRFNGAPQLVDGQADFLLSRLDAPHPRAVLDLTSLYRDQVSSARRGLMFVDDQAVLLQDEWTTGDQPVDAVSQWLTPAEVTVQPGRILLRKDGKELTINILEPADAKVTVEKSADLQKPFDANNPGISRISIATHTPAHSAGTLRLLAIPQPGGEVQAPERLELGKW